ncbi:hypothetical protein K435DRAFT_803750 [Dendrothele bispora CBS 962.96]|uniref:Uncharacterized protein n=1 Tax=Dendrothele bispora (strain CBS 962.96) TaxID=1314807 RepID=A0A4S8LH21_DENBC|nr:hypothetical protein K435DRAFT_803750 [Dendrothele bispora CBS 962.96]
MAASPSSNLSAAQRRTRLSGVFDTMVRAKLGFGPRGLAAMDYGVHFKKVPHWGGHERFVNSKGQEFEAEFFGELSDNTTCHAIGNYVSQAGKFEPIKDEQKVKWCWQLQAPTGAPKRINATWHNQVATLFNIIEDPNATRQKMWVMRSDPEQDPDIIVITTDQLYVKNAGTASATPSPSKMTKVTADDDDLDNDDSERTMSDTAENENSSEVVPPIVRKVGDLFKPSVLPGYGGGWFDHSPSVKLQQLDIRDPQGDLIPPYDVWMWVKPGTLVFVKATLYVFNMGTRKIYQLNAKSIQVLDPSDKSPSRPEVREAPTQASTAPGPDTSDLLPCNDDTTHEEGSSGPMNFKSLLGGPQERMTRSAADADLDEPMPAAETSKAAGKKKARR